MKTNDAIMAEWNQPLEIVERFGDEVLPEAVDVAARSVERGETPLRDALTILFAAGGRYALTQAAGAPITFDDPAAHPPADDGAGGSS